MIKSAAEENKKTISIIVKADVHGSKEAIEQSLNKMNSDDIEIKIIHTAVGEINESDVTLATASQAKIFGFNVKANTQAKTLSKREGISIKYFSIIYEVLDEAQKIIDGLDDDKVVETLIGKAIIKQVFELSDSSKVAGCVIEEGKVSSKSFVKIIRNEEKSMSVRFKVSEEKKIRLKRYLVDLNAVLFFQNSMISSRMTKWNFMLERKMKKTLV